jgi:hypothetical protein
MLRSFHILISAGVAVAVPALVYVLNGVLEPWALVLGLVLAFSYWYFGPWLL